MMRSLFSGVAGLKCHQTRMDSIGNNIANVNTPGFKSSRVTFIDTLTQTLSGASAATGTIGGTNAKQIGLGVGIGGVDTMFTDGSVQSTGNNTDLCLSGSGLFVVKDPSGTYYTRNGAFQTDAAGNFVTSSGGLFVQGWMASGTGATRKIDTTATTTNITGLWAGKPIAAQATTKATFANNLSSSGLTIKSISGGKNSTTYTSPTDGAITPTDTMPVTLTLSDGTIVAGTNGTPYTVGGNYGNVVKQYSTVGQQIAVSSTTIPVTITLATGETKDVSAVDTDWSYGYTTTTSNDTATANATTMVTLTLDDDTTATGDFGKLYSVGGDYTTAEKKSGTVTASSAHPVVLTLADGSTHTVTAGDYTVGTDSYTYNGITSKVAGYATQYKIKALKSETKGGGTGTTLTVGGIASHTVTSGKVDADTALALTLANGSTVQGKVGDTYTVGDMYVGDENTTDPVTVTTDNQKSITLYLADGTFVNTPVLGTYKPGDSYTYTKAGGSTPVSTTIAGYAMKSTITSMRETSKINTISATSVPTIASISVGTLNGTYASSDSPVTLTMSDGTTQTETSGKYALGNGLPITTTITAYDSLGKAHTIPVYFTRTSTDSAKGNTWTVSIATDGTGQTQLKEADGSITAVTMADTALRFTTDGKYGDGSGKAVMTLTNGANGTQTLNLDLSNLTQYSSESTVAASADGYKDGTLKSISIDSQGVITGSYTNGVNQVEAQVAIAAFNNPGGLTKSGSSLYSVSNNSGAPNVKSATALGVKITPSALEMSNVDLANEFSDMIVTQRGFQSNSKIITVSDEMLETLVNMKR